MTKVSIIIPAYNECDGLPKVLQEIPDPSYEVIVVDDGSIDGTCEIAKTYGVKVIKHEKNMGKVAAIQAGIAKATGDILVLIDADYTYPAYYIPKLVREVENGADLAIGSRFRGNTKNVRWLNRVGNRLFSYATAYISGEYVTDSQSGLRAFRKDLFERFEFTSKGLEFETEMTAKVAKHACRVVEIPIEYRERIGKSKLRPFIDGFRMFKALSLLLYSETSVISRFVMIPSIIFFLLGAYFGIYTLFDYLQYGTATRFYYPLLTVFSILLSIQLFSVGLITDHISKRLKRIEEKLERTQ